MKELVDKISSYNLFNNFFPGIIFAAIADKITSYSFLQKDIIVGLFVYYFIGLVISRVGSLLVESFLKKAKLLKFEPYNDFLSACKNDQKIELLSEINNMYRTISSLFILLIALKIYEWIENSHPTLKSYSIFLLILFLLLLFIFSYIKQTNFINKRINYWKK